jgi:hypothetical protein
MTWKKKEQNTGDKEVLNRSMRMDVWSECKL